MDNFVKTDDILKDMCGIIESSQKAAYRAVNTTLIQRNWLLGYRIASEELQGEDRAKYGAEIIKKLAKELSVEYGRGYTKSNLYSFYSFHKTYPEIFQTSSGKSVGLLSWSHYAALLQVKDEKARDWYEKEVVEQTWSVRTLQRNISSQYYYRMLKTQKKELVESEMKNLTAALYNTPVMMQGYYHAEVNHTMPEYAELEQCRNELGWMYSITFCKCDYILFI